MMLFPRMWSAVIARFRLEAILADDRYKAREVIPRRFLRDK